MPQTTPTPSRLWKQMTPAERLAAARALWMSEDAADDQVQAAMLIARQRKFRLKTVVGLGVDRQARHLASLPLIPDAVAGRILIAYHLANRRPMMSRFLDALGVPHDEGVIKEDGPAPDASKLAPAAAEIGREFPLDEVRLYLNTLVCQDPETWGGLTAIVGGLGLADREAAPQPAESRVEG